MELDRNAAERTEWVARRSSLLVGCWYWRVYLKGFISLIEDTDLTPDATFNQTHAKRLLEKYSDELPILKDHHEKMIANYKRTWREIFYIGYTIPEITRARDKVQEFGELLQSSAAHTVDLVETELESTRDYDKVKTLFASSTKEIKRIFESLNLLIQQQSALVNQGITDTPTNVSSAEKQAAKMVAENDLAEIIAAIKTEQKKPWWDLPLKGLGAGALVGLGVIGTVVTDNHKDSNANTVAMDNWKAEQNSLFESRVDLVEDAAKIYSNPSPTPDALVQANKKIAAALNGTDETPVKSWSTSTDFLQQKGHYIHCHLVKNAIDDLSISNLSITKITDGLALLVQFEKDNSFYKSPTD